MVLSNGFCELTMDEIFFVDGGEWSWKEFGQEVLGGAVSGAVGGAVAGGGLAGAGVGALGGGLGAAALYLVCGWW